MKKDGLYKCRTMKRMPRDNAFHATCMEETPFGIEVYIEKGARTTAESHQGELAREGELGGREFAPRRRKLAASDVDRAGFTSGY